MKVKKITLIGLLAACLCILAPVSFPIGVIPISLATFAIYIIASLLLWHNTILVILVYIVIGAVGLPVFSGFRGGFSILLGYTGGYIFGYILMGLAISLLLKNNKNKLWMYPIAMIVGTIFCYLFGSIWYMVESNNNLASTLAVAVVPFILPDLIKIVVASYVTYILNTKTSISSTLS